MTEQTFAAGHVFFRAGDPGDRAYLLDDGQVELLTGAAGTLAGSGSSSRATYSEKPP